MCPKWLLPAIHPAHFRTGCAWAPLEDNRYRVSLLTSRDEMNCTRSENRVNAKKVIFAACTQMQHAGKAPFACALHASARNSPQKNPQPSYSFFQASAVFSQDSAVKSGLITVNVPTVAVRPQPKKYRSRAREQSGEFAS